MNKMIYPFLMIIICGCSPKADPIPERVQELNSLTVYSANAQPAVNISFQKDAVYGDSKQVLIGRMGEVAVDSLERVYVADVGKMVIYAFEPDGRFIDQLGSEGMGPGEFSSWIRNVQIRNHRLFALDAARHRLNIFSLDSLTIESTISLAGNRSDYKSMARTFPNIRNLFVRGDDTYIAEYVKHATPERTHRYQNVELRSLYYLMESDGVILKELNEFSNAILTDLGIVYNIKDFFGHVLQGFLSDDHIYLAEPNHFLVKTFSPDGVYQQSFFYPISKIPLTRESAIEARISNGFIDLMESLDLPEFWPVLKKMVIDDQDRLWIATTVEDMNVYEWWVLEETGKLITRFKWLRNEPIEVVKNGHMYTRETDDETGLQQIVRYRIEIEEL